MVVDKLIQTGISEIGNKNLDTDVPDNDIRLTMQQNIRLEEDFYAFFRNMVRISLSNMLKEKGEIQQIIDDEGMLYMDRLEK